MVLDLKDTYNVITELNDCRSEEQSALQRKAENPDGGIFIPKCTTDGKWQRAQCHDAVGYCWCVNESNGRPVSGTATKGKDPVCDFEAEREIQGIKGKWRDHGSQEGSNIPATHLLKFNNYRISYHLVIWFIFLFSLN